MKKYEFINEWKDDNKVYFARMANCGSKECDLIIDKDYHIERFTFGKYLFYVHIKEGRLEKVCVYREKDKENR